MSGESLFSRNIHFLHVLSEAKNKKQRENLIKYATRLQVMSVVEVIVNTLHGNVKISPALFNELKKKKKILRALKARKSWKVKRGYVMNLRKVLNLLLHDILKSDNKE